MQFILYIFSCNLVISSFESSNVDNSKVLNQFFNSSIAVTDGVIIASISSLSATAKSFVFLSSGCDKISEESVFFFLLLPIKVLDLIIRYSFFNKLALLKLI